MDLHVEWWSPFRLRNGRRSRLTYTFDEIEDLPDGAGVYIFGRRHGMSFSPIYIGKATNLARRIPQQLNNNRLMNALLDAPSGYRELIIGELHARGGQQAVRAIEIIERGLIKFALAEGHKLVNVQGTRIRSHSVVFNGNRRATSWLPGRNVQFE